MGKPIDIIRQTRPRAPHTTVKKNNSSGVLLIIFLAIIFLGTSSSKIFENKLDNKENIQQNAEEKESEATDTNREDPFSFVDKPETSQKLTTEKKDSKITILNATKQTGAAALVKGEMERMGYTIRSIGTTEEIYKDNKILYKEDKKDLANEIAKDLADYNVIAEQSTNTNDNDIVIIISITKKSTSL